MVGPAVWAGLVLGVVAACPLACSNTASSPAGDAGNSDSGMADGSPSDGGGSGGDSSGGDSSDGGGSDGDSSNGGGPDAGTDRGSSDGGSADSGADAMTCTNACPEGLTQCGSDGVQTCELLSDAGGCTKWITTKTCGPHQTCSVSAGVASCPCVATVCTQAGTVCQDPMTVATCALDADGGATDAGGGCIYVASTTACPSPQSCAGASPTAACAATCTSTCTLGQTACVPGGLATCTMGADGGAGCGGYGAPFACPAGQTCTGTAGAAACTCTPDPVCGTSTSASACLPTSSTQVVSCSMGANGCAVSSPSACPSGLVCERLGSPACVDPNWAEWPMIDTPDYTDNGDGTVTDNGTGLVWQQVLSMELLTQAQAAAYCASLNLNGYTDWRLPSIVELVSIVDPTQYNSAISNTYFPNTPASFYWSTTPDASAAGLVWTVTFDVGSITSAGVIESGYARCVR